MIASDEHWRHVADLLTSAGLSGEWTLALNAMADACGAERGQLIGIGHDKAIPFNWMTRTDLRAVQEFLDIDGGDPAINPRVKMGLHAPLLQSWHDVQCSTKEALRLNFRYADYCRRHDLPHGSQTNLLRSRGMLIGLAVLRSDARGVPQAEDRRAFEALAPFVRAAVRAQLTLEGQGAAIIAGALDGVQIAAFVCDASGQVQAHTEAAEVALQRGVLTIHGRRLAAAGAGGGRELEAAVTAAATGLAVPDRPTLETVVVRRTDGPDDLEVVDVIALPRRPFGLGFEPRVLVVVRGGTRDSADLAGVVAQAYGLTPAEADIAVRLAEGHTRDSIAEERGASLETVRSQIKVVFAKLDVRREAELIARLNLIR